MPFLTVILKLFVSKIGNRLNSQSSFDGTVRHCIYGLVCLGMLSANSLCAAASSRLDTLNQCEQMLESAAEHYFVKSALLVPKYRLLAILGILLDESSEVSEESLLLELISGCRDLSNVRASRSTLSPKDINFEFRSKEGVLVRGRVVSKESYVVTAQLLRSSVCISEAEMVQIGLPLLVSHHSYGALRYLDDERITAKVVWQAPTYRRKQFSAWVGDSGCLLIITGDGN